MHCQWDCQLVQPFLNAAWSFLKILGVDPPYNLAILLCGIYPKELKLAYYVDAIIPIFETLLLLLFYIGHEAERTSQQNYSSFSFLPC